MDLLNGLDWQNVGFVMLVTFGAVNAINFFWKNEGPNASKRNLILSLVIAFSLGFVPASFSNVFLEHAKDAIAAALSLNGLYQGLGGIAKKVGIASQG